MDLEDFKGYSTAQNEGIAVEILHPVSGEPTGATIWVAGPDSHRARKAKRSVLRDMIGELKGQDITDDHEMELSSRVLAKTVIKWEGVKNKGKETQCTEASVLTLFKNHPWVEDQVNQKASNRANFTKG